MINERRIKRTACVAACLLASLLVVTPSRAQDKGHGAAVSAKAKSACTAKNPHNPHAKANHGMCVSAFANKHGKGKKHGHGKGKSKQGTEPSAQPEATEAPEPTDAPGH